MMPNDPSDGGGAKTSIFLLGAVVTTALAFAGWAVGLLEEGQATVVFLALITVLLAEIAVRLEEGSA